MRLSSLAAGLLLLTVPSGAEAQPQPLGPIWRNGRAAIVLTPCPPGGDHDEWCRAVEVQRGGKVDKLGAGYIKVIPLWARRPGMSGPDALVLGDDGGSGGDGDLFAVSLTPGLQVRKLSGERMDWVKVHPGRGPLRLDLAFDVEFFNGAPHGGVTIVPIPLRWTNGDFSVDMTELTGRRFSPSELDFRALAMSQEFHQWAEDRFPTPRLYPPEARSGTPVAVQALAELMLSGHADQARELLHRAWPRDWERGDRWLGGEDAFWAALCGMVRHPWWKRFDLARLPHADLIQSGSAHGV